MIFSLSSIVKRKSVVVIFYFPKIKNVLEKKILFCDEKRNAFFWKSKISDYFLWFFCFFFLLKTPQVGLEPTTYRLTADRSTTELLRMCFLFCFFCFVFYHFFFFRSIFSSCAYYLKGFFTPDGKPRRHSIYLSLTPWERVQKSRLILEGIMQYYSANLTYKSHLGVYHAMLTYSCSHTIAWRTRKSRAKVRNTYGQE